MKYFDSRLKDMKKKLSKWSLSHFVGVTIFNLILIFLFLLYSAGYFKPYVPISINLIVTIGLVSSIFLLGARSRVMFIISLFFWLFAGFLKFVGVDVWAERTTIYTFQSLLVGVVLLIIENIGIIKKDKK